MQFFTKIIFLQDISVEVSGGAITQQRFGMQFFLLLAIGMIPIAF